MTMPRTLDETEVSDGKGGKRLVRPGDSVVLLPANPEDEYQAVDGIYIDESTYDFLQHVLRRGPYSIESIGQWPCGRVTLYVRTPTSIRAGAYAGNFRFVG